MKQPKYIKTDVLTANISEFLLEKLGNYERINSELVAKVCTLSNPLDYSQLFTEKETANRLCVSTPTIFRLRKQGKIHYHKIGINIRYSLRNIVEFEDSCRR